MGPPKALQSTIFELPATLVQDESAVAAPAAEERLSPAALEALSLNAVEQPDAEQEAQPSGATCIACGVGAPGFRSAEEQRAHFKTNWHRYNVKRRLEGQPHVSRDQFEGMADDDVGSISGSESEGGSEEEEGADGAARLAGSPQFAFATPEGKQFAVWRCLLAPDREHGGGGGGGAPDPAACLAELQRLRGAGGRWAVLMLRGGHFAAAVFDVVPARVSNPKISDKFVAVAHKSLHRYVVRAGAGGKQSAQDATGKFAKSAGSRLRRHNEAALQRDIRETLESWRELLAGCALVLVHAPSSNRQELFGGDTPLLDRSDPKFRRIPFTTRRPTFSETKRVLRILVTVYEAGAEAVEEGGRAGAAAEKKKAPPAAPQPSPEALAAAAAEAEAAAAAAEAARLKKAEKRARQKAREKEERQAAAAASQQEAAAAAAAAAEDDIAAAAAAVAAMSGKLQAKPTLSGAGPAAGGGGKASGPQLRLSTKPQLGGSEDPAFQRARAAAAAEARMKALQQASQQQQLW